MVFGVKEKPYKVSENLDFIPNYEVRQVQNEDGSETEEVKLLSPDEYKKKNLGTCVSEGSIIQGAASPDYLSKFQQIDELERRVDALEITNKKTD